MRKLSDIKIDIPKFPKLIISTLEDAGFEAYIVGGCVRDYLLNKNPDDFDITTNASPLEVKKLFKRTIDTGIKHGTVSVLFYENDKPYTYEVTTFRIDGEYVDGRHPKDVRFVNDLKEDLLRRDFTVNAMAYNDKKGLVDEFGGLVDLDKKIIRAVGNPTERFTEDALRLMRAVRFSAKLGFVIDEDTKDAIPPLAKNLAMVSKERVQVELTKTITSANPEFVSLYFDLGLAKYIATNFENVKVGKFKVNLSPYMAYACLLYNEDKMVANQILRELKFDNNNIYKVTALLDAKRYLKRTDINIAVKELVNDLKYDLAYDFVELIDINGEDKKLVLKIKKLLNKYKGEKTPIFIGDLKIDGNELMSIGFKGQEVGVALTSLQRIIFKKPLLNDKKLLKEMSKKAYNVYKEKKFEEDDINGGNVYEL